MTPVLKIGIAGLGTVGGGVLRLLQAHGDLLAQRSGRRIVVTAVSARDRHRDRGVPLDGVRWYDDAVALAADPEVDVVVELIGGANGVAKTVCETAIAHGKPVVTANKALLAVHGPALAAAAEEAGVALAFEAAVAGGIPAIKGLREGLAGNRIDGVFGILNGTCNYILTEMRTTGREFAEVLAEAQKLGYAEADPSFDVDGVDAAHKLAVLAALAFNARVEFDDLHIEGIRQVSALDIAYAQELGYRIKLLGIARRTEEGLSLRVHPCMVAEASPIAHVEGVFNAVVAQGDFVGQVMMTGRGAGAGPTASAVVADLVDLARGLKVPTLGIPAARLERAAVLPMDHRRGAYYLRLMVVDRPGVIADVAAAMRDQQISVESLLQRGRSPGDAVPLVIITHETDEAAMTRLLAALGALDAVLEPPHVIRIEDL
ncbi:homoserine dehydrogenase [Inquilinus limosus]|uniref:Homoserine dehydrogenase n=1 Tax=Inquilinus limosus MP06 TaxID=1398085 RepID=A0A0A0D0Q0_9PROT|nr:homoserine dehydrogenase [Inquilinus limosus]KGM31604.1 homoserine dehydrogenase [Inquilinus limosus MP06]